VSAPVRAEATVTSTARPSAVPTWAAVLSTPEARPCRSAGTAAVPLAVEATEATPSPRPSSTKPATIGGGRPPDASMAASPPAPSVTPSRPPAMVQSAPSRPAAASHAPASDPITTATLMGATVTPARAGE
jgi:hypothetical protein